MTHVQILLSQTTEIFEVAVVNKSVHVSHAFCIHPSDIPGMNLVSTVFDGRNYGGWRRAVIIAQNKLGFIDGSLDVPADKDLTNTRPVQHLSQFMQDPCQSHLTAALRVLRYLLMIQVLVYFSHPLPLSS